MVRKRIVIIGGGLAGYPAAIKAARLGAEVTLVEKENLGGVCLNWGCIPTKSLLQSASVAHTVRNAGTFGVFGGEWRVDFHRVMDRKNQVVEKLRAGVATLLKARKIKLVEDRATLLSPTQVATSSGERLEADAVIIATGSRPSLPPIEGLRKAAPLDSNGFLVMERLPASALIIGGGVVGVEFAQVLQGLGCPTVILEMAERLIPGLDGEIAELLRGFLEEQGIEILTGANVRKVTVKGGLKTVDFENNGQQRVRRAHELVVATGRTPRLDGIVVDGLQVENGALKVDNAMRTSLEGVFAAGDVTGAMMLAHVAMAQGECAAENTMGGHRVMDYSVVPSCIYTTPEVAWVGLDEKRAAELYEIKVGRFPFAACGKAQVLNQGKGMVKIVAGKRHGEVRGVHIIGPNATDLIAEAVLALKLEATVEELAESIHPHPTLSEALMEAGSSLAGGAVHIP